MIEYFKDNQFDINDYRFCVGFGYDEKEAEDFKKELISALQELDAKFDQDVPIRQIGATIGVHTGPHPLGVGLIKKAM